MFLNRGFYSLMRQSVNALEIKLDIIICTFAMFKTHCGSDIKLEFVTEILWHGFFKQLPGKGLNSKL